MAVIHLPNTKGCSLTIIPKLTLGQSIDFVKDDVEDAVKFLSFSKNFKKYKKFSCAWYYMK